MSSIDPILIGSPDNLDTKTATDPTDIIQVWDPVAENWRQVTVTDLGVGGLKDAGTWNAATNTPTLSDSDPPTVGRVWRVSVSGSTSLGGVSSWKVGDLLFDTGSGYALLAEGPQTAAQLRATIGTAIASTGGNGGQSGLLAATAAEKLNGIETGAQVNPSNLDGVPDSATRKAISATQLSAVGNLPADTTTALAGKAATTTTISAGNGLSGGGDLSTNRSLSVSFTSSGGVNGTAITAARGDHTHDVVTSSINGLMLASDKARLDASVTTPAFALATISTSNNTATWTADTSNYVWNINSGGIRIASRDTTNVTSIKFEGYISTAAASAGAKFLVVASVDNGTTWKWIDGETINRTGNTINAGPTAGISSATLYPVAADATGKFSVTIPLASGFRAASTIFDVVLSPSTTGTNPAIRAGSIMTAGFSSATGVSLPAEITEVELQNAAGSDVRLVTSRTFEILRRQNMAHASHVWMTGRTVKRLSADFGANNLVADAEPHSSGGTSQSTKLTNIMSSLTGPTDLIIDQGEFYCITYPIIPAVNVDGIRIINKGGRGTGGFVNTWTGAGVYSRGQILCTGNQGALDFTDTQVWRLAAGVDGGDDIHAGDMAIRIPLIGDFNAVDTDTVAGSRIVLVGAWVYSSNSRLKPIERWTADVVKAEQVGSDYIFHLSEPIPFDFHADNNATHGWAYKRADTTDIQGIAWALFYDLPGPDYYASHSFHTTEFEMHNLYLENLGQVLLGQLPRNFLIKDCTLHSPYAVVYGNSGQCGSFDGCDGTFGANAMEISFVCVDTHVRDCRFSWNNDATYGGGSAGTGNLISFQEYARMCSIRNTYVNASGWNPAEASHKALRDTGRDNMVNGLHLLVGTTNATCINAIAEGDAVAPTGCLYKDMYVETTDASYNGMSFALNGSNHKMGGIRFNHASAGTAQAQINSSCSNILLQDIVQNTGSCRVNSGTTNIRFERCSLGTITDSSGGELVQVSGSADYLRHKSSRHNFGAS